MYQGANDILLRRGVADFSLGAYFAHAKIIQENLSAPTSESNAPPPPRASSSVRPTQSSSPTSGRSTRTGLRETATIPRKDSLETVMQPCNACRELAGKPSTAPPHGDLAASGFSAFGAPSHTTKVSSNWCCTVCGSRLFQNTADGDPPSEWAIGERPLDWPEKRGE